MAKKLTKSAQKAFRATTNPTFERLIDEFHRRFDKDIGVVMAGAECVTKSGGNQDWKLYTEYSWGNHDWGGRSEDYLHNNLENIQRCLQKDKPEAIRLSDEDRTCYTDGNSFIVWVESMLPIWEKHLRLRIH